MSELPESSQTPLKKTPLYESHVMHGGRMVPFAGFEMPIQFKGGILEEHAWTRAHAGAFDISHMGQAFVVASDGRFETVAAALEKLVPADILSLKPGQQRYTQFLNSGGGVIDDLMVTRPVDAAHPGRLFLILNAARFDVDCQHLQRNLAGGVQLEPRRDLALIAVQGPEAAKALAGLAPEALELRFMAAQAVTIDGVVCHVSRSGYTGEDGFEISMAAMAALQVWDRLLAIDCVRAIGLGARNTLRLEAGLCLYGHDLDEGITPIEAGLAWSIGRQQRQAGGFLGAARVQRDLRDGVQRRRVGLALNGRVPVRDGAEIQSLDGRAVGVVTSGGFSPTLGQPIAMGYVETASSKPDTDVQVIIRQAVHGAKVVALPFVPHRYVKGG